MKIRALLAIAAVAALIAGSPAAHASTPGPNGRLAFSEDTAEGFQIFTMLPDGTDLQQITHIDGDATDPDWSPDGQHIAFSLADATHAGIAIMNSDGSGLHDLTPTGLQEQPAYTPDGQHLVFDKLAKAGDDSIWIMDLNGGHQRRLTRNPYTQTGGDLDANVSPDGQTVSFVRIKVPEQTQALFSVNIDGSDLQQLTPYRLDVGVKHDWSPDGTRIVLTAHADESPAGTSANVATIRPDGTGLRYLTHYRGGQINALAGSYSPDDRWIAYRIENHGKFSMHKILTYGADATLIARFVLAPRFIDWGTNTDPRDPAGG